MRYRLAVLLSASLLAMAATAQTSPKPPSADHLRLTLPPAVVHVPTDSAGKGAGVAPAVHFIFDTGHRNSLSHQPPPRPMDQAVVMGKQRPWLGGKPPVSCAFTPMDPLCR